MATELFHASVAQLSGMLARKEISSVELSQVFLDRIEQNRDLNVYLDVRPEVTLDQARAADERIARGEATALTGIPVAHKDLFVTRQWATTAASKMLEGYMSPFDATVVQNLDRAGMVCLGKVNCDEFAMGGGNENSAFGKVLNPWDKGCVPGGSSGGSAAAVAAGLAPVSTGTDTGGSVREPAVFTGTTGLKPTYGRPSRWGVIAFASSLDTPGILARTAEDCALVMNEMIEFDPKDSTCVDLPKEDFARYLNTDIKGMKIGIPRSWFAKGLDDELAASIEEVIRTYERMGAKIVDIELPTVDLKRGIDKAVAAVVAFIKDHAEQVDDNYDKIEQVATVSANNDAEIGKLLADAMRKVSKDGVITIEESNTVTSVAATFWAKATVCCMQFDLPLMVSKE